MHSFLPLTPSHHHTLTPSQVASEVKVNVLTADVLDVLQLLVKYGYYDDKQDVDDVLEPLITVLDGMSDSLYFTEKSSESELNI